MPTPGKEAITQNLNRLLKNWPKISDAAKHEIKKIIDHAQKGKNILLRICYVPYFLK